MATKIFYFSGPCKWAKVYQPDDYGGDLRYKVNLYLNKADLRTLADSGSKVKVKEDDDGKYVTFSRKQSQEINGEVKELGPPLVIDAEKNPFDAEIGNGSEVTVKVAIYDTRMGKGTRMEGIRVDKHVPYDPESYANTSGEF